MRKNSEELRRAVAKAMDEEKPPEELQSPYRLEIGGT